MKTQKVREGTDQEFRYAGEASTMTVLLKVSLEINSLFNLCQSPRQGGQCGVRNLLRQLVKGVQKLRRV